MVLAGNVAFHPLSFVTASPPLPPFIASLPLPSLFLCSQGGLLLNHSKDDMHRSAGKDKLAPSLHLLGSTGVVQFKDQQPPGRSPR